MSSEGRSMWEAEVRAAHDAAVACFQAARELKSCLQSGRPDVDCARAGSWLARAVQEAEARCPCLGDLDNELTAVRNHLPATRVHLAPNAHRRATRHAEGVLLDLGVATEAPQDFDPGALSGRQWRQARNYFARKGDLAGPPGLQEAMEQEIAELLLTKPRGRSSLDWGDEGAPWPAPDVVVVIVQPAPPVCREAAAPAAESRSGTGGAGHRDPPPEAGPTTGRPPRAEEGVSGDPGPAPCGASDRRWRDEDLDREQAKVRLLLRYMVGRPRAPLRDVCPHVWGEEPEKVSKDAVQSAVWKVNRFLVTNGDPRRLSKESDGEIAELSRNAERITRLPATLRAAQPRGMGKSFCAPT
jgi:hypothetical protein